MSPFSPGYVTGMTPAQLRSLKTSNKRPVIVPIERDIHARIGDKQPSRTQHITRGCSQANGAKV
jgi:hypothetical protein